MIKCANVNPSSARTKSLWIRFQKHQNSLPSFHCVWHFDHAMLQTKWANVWLLDWLQADQAAVMVYWYEKNSTWSCQPFYLTKSSFHIISRFTRKLNWLTYTFKDWLLIPLVSKPQLSINIVKIILTWLDVLFVFMQVCSNGQTSLYHWLNQVTLTVPRSPKACIFGLGEKSICLWLAKRNRLQP